MKRSTLSAALAPLFRWSCGASLMTAVSSATALADPAADIQFNRHFLVGGADQSLDLSEFEAGRAIAPGVYTLDVHVNDTWLARSPVHLIDAEPGQLVPCLAAADIARWGIILDPPPGEPGNDTPDSPAPCVALSSRLPHAQARLDPLALALHLDIPQRFLARRSRDWVDPSQWDQGAPAAVLDYSANVHRSDGQGGAYHVASLGYRIGLNAGAWRLRHNGFLRWEDGTAARRENGETYFQRDLHRLQATLRAGQGYTSGELFSSVGFTGIRLASDDRMLPQSQRGYAPLIEGVTESAARIQIYQQGRLLHETNVAPGPFLLEDLYATAYNGDLEVVITEANGRERRFIQPFSAVPQLLRPGQHRFGATVGQTEGRAGFPATPLLEATWRQGITNTTTVHAGLRRAQHYHAAVAGVALNTRAGGLSADVTTSSARPSNGEHWRGYAYRTTYSRDIALTGTHLSLAAYRYSTTGYLDLGDLLALRSANAGPLLWQPGRSRSRVELNASQALPGYAGRVWFNGAWTSYWEDTAALASFSAGYSHRWRSASYSIAARRSRAVDTRRLHARDETSVNLTLSIPLGRAATSPSLLATSTVSGRAQQVRMGLSASASDALNYFGGIERSSAGSAGADAGLFYQGDRAATNASAIWTPGHLQLNVGASGGVVAHQGGLTFAHTVGDTFGLVHATAAQGATVDHGRMRVDRRGYAVVPHLTPYRTARIDIDPRGIPEDIQFTSTRAIAVPTAGAMVRLMYATEQRGNQHAFIVRAPHDQPIPFGAKILDDQGEALGMVGQGGQAWFAAAAHVPRVRIQWPAGAATIECEVDLREAATVRTCNPLLRETAETTRPVPATSTSSFRTRVMP
ncbi:fimbria/pilus outer membrane usher protein [Stenotrophomonas sp. B1-1]|uniref:fimbria/pilus outer membrane usher protein n=1 Tax=Stenotrophomonas sp. B1-1 TaxID=2710648 RepID=UPI0013DB78FB|nr:fimbria/pilus outer membrane usher protein [Stenotrophomonas sp. B1-1]